MVRSEWMKILSKKVSCPNWNKSSRALRLCQPTVVFTSSKLDSTATVRSHKTEQKICTWGDDITPLQGLQGASRGFKTTHEAYWEIGDVYFYFKVILSWMSSAVLKEFVDSYMLRLLTRLNLKDSVLCCDLICTLSWYRWKIQARIHPSPLKNVWQKIAFIISQKLHV